MSASIGDNIRGLLAEQHLTQDRLASIAGVSRETVTRWIGDLSQPRQYYLGKICKACGLARADLTSPTTGKAMQVARLLAAHDWDLRAAGLPPRTKVSRFRELFEEAVGEQVALAANNLVPVKSEADLAQSRSAKAPATGTAAQPIDIPGSVASAHPAAFAWRIADRSMADTLPQGCYAIVDPAFVPASDELPRLSDALLLISTKTLGTCVRRARGGHNLIMLLEDNPHGNDAALSPADVTIHGTVVFWQAAAPLGAQLL